MKRNPFTAPTNRTEPLPPDTEKKAPPPLPVPKPAKQTVLDKPAALPQLVDVQLMGILEGRDNVALIVDQGTVETLRAGDEVQGFRVMSVGDGRVKLRRDGRDISLKMPR
jgi:hypothetical protein